MKAVHCYLTLPVNFPFQTVCENNVEFYSHLKSHVNRSVAADDKVACTYCLAFFPDEAKRDYHQKTVSVNISYLGVLALCKKYTQY